MKPSQGKGARLTEGPVSKAIFSLMLPMMLGMLAIVVNNVAGAFFVARVSTEQLAAVSFTFPVSFIVGAIAMALGVGTSSVVSRLFGSGNRDEVKRITAHAMLLGVICGVVVLIIGLNTIDPLFRLLGADEKVLPFIHRYMQIYYWGGIFLVAPMIANSVLRASGDAKRPAMIMTTAAVLNVIIDPILIFGLFGFPRMEIEGAALGGVLSNALTMCASAYFVVYREKLVDFRQPGPRPAHGLLAPDPARGPAVADQQPGGAGHHRVHHQPDRHLRPGVRGRLRHGVAARGPDGPGDDGALGGHDALRRPELRRQAPGPGAGGRELRLPLLARCTASASRSSCSCSAA